MDDNKGIENDKEKDIEKKKQDKDKQEEAYLNSCIKDIMSRPSGRHLFLWIIEGNGMGEDMFNPDPYKHAYSSGIRSVSVKLTKKLLSTCPDNYYRMEQEHKYIDPEDEE